VTKELDDCWVFNTKSFSYTKLFEPAQFTKEISTPEAVSPLRRHGGGKSPMRNRSSMQKAKSTIMSGASPMRRPHGQALMSPTRRRAKIAVNKKDRQDNLLQSPTSNDMKNSYIIKNADASFDSYYHSMRKRTKYIEEMKGKGDDAGYGKMSDHRPQARDGHSGVVFDENLIIFGGDRHHMPFNDTHQLDLVKQMERKKAF